jgi:ankyrin repeat protein
MALSGSVNSERPAFLDCLTFLDELDKLCSRQRLPAKFDTLPEDRKKIIKENIEKNKIEFEVKENEFLSKFSEDSKERALLVEIIKTIKVRQGILEASLENRELRSKYAPHFNQALYHEILPYCQLAYLYETNGIAEEHAEKLSVLFDSVKDILAYFQIQSQNKKEPSKNLVHDACLFELRDVNHISNENWKKWKILVSGDKGNTAFIMEILPNAKVIEDLVASHYSKDKKPDVVKNSTAELIKKIAEINKKVKTLSSRAADLDEKEEEILKTARQELSNEKLKLFEACKGLALKDMNISYLIAFNQKILSNTGSFSYLVANIGEQNYNRFKKLKAKREKKYREQNDREHNCEGNNDVYIPNITIDGKDLSPELDGFYLMKVNLQDELQAARMACFGKLTDCCQSLSGEAGDPCTEHALTSPFGGGYVICKGDINNPTIDHYLVGGCWAWRSRDNAIVFDSIEAGDKYDDFHINTVVTFFNKLAATMVEKEFVKKVACGASSGISEYVGFEASLNRVELFQDYAGYCDSRFQRVIEDINAPFYFYSTDPVRRQNTLNLAEAAMKEDKPLLHSDYMCQLLNFIALEIKEGRNMDLLSDVLVIADKFGKHKEVSDILEVMHQYIELNDDNIDSIIEKIKSKTFYNKMLNGNKDSILLALLKKEPMTDSLKEKIDDLINDLDLDIINLPDNDGLTPFMRAAQLKDLTLCEKLIKKGADAFAVDRDSENVLFNAYHYFRNHWLSEESYVDFLLTLISKFNLDINSVDKKGETLLMKLAQSGNISFLEEFLKKGADITIQDDYGFTILHHAIMSYQYEACLHLIKNDKNLLNMADNNGFIPLVWAIDRGAQDLCLKLIEAGADFNIPYSEGITPLRFAINKRMQDVCLKLIEKGADVNNPDREGNTLLHLASYNGMSEVYAALIEKGASIDSKNNDGNTPLHLAVYSNKMTSVCLGLIAEGADVGLQNNNSQTPLHLALLNEEFSEAFCLALIQKGVGINIPDNNGNTPLHLAMLKVYPSEKICLALINQGADVNVRNAAGKTPLDLVKEIRKPTLNLALLNSLRELILESKIDITSVDSDGQTFLMKFIETKDTSFLETLMNKGVVIDAKDNFGKTALMYAIELRSDEVCLFLIDKCKELINITDAEGVSPLQLAIHHDLPEVYQKLIDEGADVNITDNKDNTALHLAVLKGNLDLCKFLIANKADVNASNIAGKTPFDLAVNHSPNEEICLALIDGGADANDCLDWAIQNRLPALCLALIKRNEDINSPGSSGKTLLDLARKKAFSDFQARNSMVEVYLVLAQSMGEDVNMPDEKGDILLHSNIDRNEEKNCLMIIQNAGNIDVRDKDQNTALHLAAKERMIDVCLALIEKKADVNASDVDGNTSLHLAIADNEKLQFARNILNGKINRRVVANRDFEFYKKREENIGDVTSTLILALIKGGANVNSPNNDGKTPLHLAIENNAPEICALLIENGAAVNPEIITLAKEKGVELVLPKEDKRSAAFVFSRQQSHEKGLEVEKENKENKADKDELKPSI